jgi:hypothetical protein
VKAKAGQRSLPQTIHGQLCDEILRGMLPPGAQNRQDSARRALRDEQVPVRETSRQLEVEGLMSYQLSRGADQHTAACPVDHWNPTKVVPRHWYVLMSSALTWFLCPIFFCTDYGLRLVDQVLDEDSFIESVQHIPVEARPCSVSLM